MLMENWNCVLIMFSFANDFGNVKHHKTSLRGVVQDYVISFNEEQCEIECIMQHSMLIVKELFEAFKKNDKTIKGRLIAKVNYDHLNPMTNEETERSFHFPSYSNEVIEDSYEFFITHMTKIANRIAEFNANHGSNLKLKNIEHIHIQITCIN